MAKTYGIPISSRRSYRPIPEGPPMLPQLPQRVINNKKGPKTSEIINAVNKEKWTFLQRLLAIEEKHEQKKLARQKEQQLSKKTEELEENQENNPAANGRWIFDQILDDDEDDESNPDLSDRPSRENNRNQDANQSIFVSSSSSINKHSTSSPHEQDSTNPHSSDASSSSGHVHQKEDTLMSRAKRKRPLRLPPILLPPLYTVRPRPLQEREFLTPTRIRGPITDEEWEDLYNCRYIRHATPKYALQLSPSQSSFYF